MCSQSTPSKKGLLLISSTPGAPILCSHSQQNLEKTEAFQHTSHSLFGKRKGITPPPPPFFKERNGREQGTDPGNNLSFKKKNEFTHVKKPGWEVGEMFSD